MNAVNSLWERDGITLIKISGVLEMKERGLWRGVKDDSSSNRVRAYYDYLRVKNPLTGEVSLVSSLASFSECDAYLVPGHEVELYALSLTAAPHDPSGQCFLVGAWSSTHQAVDMEAVDAVVAAHALASRRSILGHLKAAFKHLFSVDSGTEKQRVCKEIGAQAFQYLSLRFCLPVLNTLSRA